MTFIQNTRSREDTASPLDYLYGFSLIVNVLLPLECTGVWPIEWL